MRKAIKLTLGRGSRRKDVIGVGRVGGWGSGSDTLTLDHHRHSRGHKWWSAGRVGGVGTEGWWPGVRSAGGGGWLGWGTDNQFTAGVTRICH